MGNCLNNPEERPEPQRLSLIGMPNELHEIIFDDMDVPSLMATGSTCSELHRETRRARQLCFIVRAMCNHYAPQNRRYMENVGLIAWTRRLHTIDLQDAHQMWSNASTRTKNRLDRFISSYATAELCEDGNHRMINLSVHSIFTMLWVNVDRPITRGRCDT